MAIVLYKYQIVISLVCGIFGIFFLTMGYKYYKVGLFSMGFLLIFFLVISFLDMLIVYLATSEKSKIKKPNNNQQKNTGSSWCLSLDCFSDFSLESYLPNSSRSTNTFQVQTNTFRAFFNFKVGFTAIMSTLLMASLSAEFITNLFIVVVLTTVLIIFSYIKDK